MKLWRNGLAGFWNRSDRKKPGSNEIVEKRRQVDSVEFVASFLPH
jgi:hypothetical protein